LVAPSGTTLEGVIRFNFRPKNDFGRKIFRSKKFNSSTEKVSLKIFMT